ncbi:acetoacetate--CoA ligase [Alcanivorax sp. N3-2A]|nr:acetoacetate--CoA ligase [Alcanivorax sp. N3-2A]|tara:strand:+ start:47424 stop:49388 length:1965 start_codon:yes stop_codon:yes gene_type:complete
MSYTHNLAPLCWTPGPERIASAAITRFARQVGLEGASYADLHRYSVTCLEDFWAEFWRFAKPVASDYQQVLSSDGQARMVGARFFVGATMNFAENLLAGDADQVAVIETGEDGVGAALTLAQLRQRVAGAQQALRELGVGEGDRVAGLMPNTVDTLVMVLATASIGAIWSACAPEFGVNGVLDRFGQIEPRVLVAVPRYRYNGRLHDIGERVAEIANGLKVRHLLLCGEGEVERTDAAVARLETLAAGAPSQPDYVALPFNHPLYVIYTSGTTGLPKCIVHSAGGTLINHRKEHMLHCDIGPGDRVMYYTSTAWMMYHWMITARASGATLVLYDGAAIPKRDGELDHDALWRIAAETGATHFGTSPKYLSLLEQAGRRPADHYDLSALRMVMSAGAPLTEENFRWVYGAVKADLCLASISGGTEILGCFVMGNPAGPVYAGEIQVPALGMAMAMLDERDIPVLGRHGDLVCTEPFPSMPLGFWGDGGWQRYLDTYFGERADVWTHGDVAYFTASGGVVITGRSDTLLKPGGVRMGPSEIYRVVETIDGIEDSLVVGYPIEGGDMDLWLFVVTEAGRELDEPLSQRIRDALLREASPRHVPKRLFQVNEIPYTLNGKKVEKAVLQMLTGKPVKNKGSLLNPDCLEQFVAVAEVQA